jgi:hypothetical protein
MSDSIFRSPEAFVADGSLAAQNNLITSVASNRRIPEKIAESPKNGWLSCDDDVPFIDDGRSWVDACD